GVLGQRRVGQRTELLQARLLVLQAQLPRLEQVLGHVVTEDLEGALHPGAGGDGGAGGAAQVRVVEVGQTVGCPAHLAAGAALLPGEDGVVGTHPGEDGADVVAVADDDAVHAADLARLGGDVHPAGRADEGEGGLGAGAGDLQRGGAAGLGEGAAGEEGTAPGGDGLLHPGGDDGGGQATNRAAPAVEQAGLAGEGLPVLDDADDVAVATLEAAAGDDDDVAGVAVELGHRLPQPTRGDTEVELGLDDDPAGDDVQPPGEAQGRGDLRLADR